MPKNLNYELVKLFTHYNKQKEIILKTSESKFELIELKKQHKDNSNTRYIVRPQIIKINDLEKGKIK